MRLLWPMNRADLWAAGVAGFVAMAVYGWTAAPGVTFKDSGELIVAAVHLGVPHPTGYPLWTILAGLFSWLPLGSAAREVNLFSGVCAAFATALVAALIANLGRHSGRSPWVSGGIAVSTSLVFAFSVCVWSQAVFAEVYTLHIAVAAVLWWALYRWFRDPAWRWGFLVCVFLVALGMTNHHLMLALAPLPLFLAFWTDRRAIWELTGYSAAAGALLFLGFGALSAQSTIWETALRTGQLAVVAIIALILMRSRLTAWRTGLWILPVVALGLLPYLYMPWASSTNPPMNWGYARTTDGFFYSVNRSPYRGPLTAQLQGTLGRLVGTEEDSGETDTGLGQRVSLLGQFALRYLVETTKSFTSLTWILVAAALWVARRAGPMRPWVLTLGMGFLLSAFFQPASAALAGSAGRLEWNLQMPYLGYSYLPLALLAGLGANALAGWVGRRRSWGPAALASGLFLLPAVGLDRNHSSCNQRHHDFALEYGREMIDPMPTGSVLFGGSDPGRFIPTYMIFGESFEKKRFKADPDFDRRDVYLITQTQLYSRFYRQYIRDHYGEDRPEVGFLGRLLGRHEQYPAKPLNFPTEEQVAEILQTMSNRQLPLNTLAPALAEWIFLNNRDEHEFFVEESIPMPWTKPYAVPSGPIVRLAREPLKELPEEAVAINRSYWRQLGERLQQNPLFEDDFDARIAYSDLRFRLARIYQSHGLSAEAEFAYQQALQLMPRELNSLATYTDFLIRHRRPAEALELVSEFAAEHPTLARLHRQALLHQQTDQIQGAAHTQFLLAPADDNAFRNILSLAQDKERDPARMARLREDLQRWEQRPGDAIVFRRILAAYRQWKLDGLGDHLALRFLRQTRSPRATQLIIADQLLADPRLNDASRALRIELAGRGLDSGETELARKLLRGDDREDAEVALLLKREKEIRVAQVALQPLLLRLAAVENISQEALDSLSTSAAGRSPGLAEEVIELSRILRRYLKDSRSPRRLEALVTTLRRLHLPEDARGILTQQTDAPQVTLVQALRLAANDLLPQELAPLADALEARSPSTLSPWLALAGFRLASHDQVGLRRAIAWILERSGPRGLLDQFRGDPQLAPLVEDPRFLLFVEQALSTEPPNKRVNNKGTPP
ncbi:MAG: DUF2723 domain-containing protein [Deltaproteobacteria bacterium]|nr:DUF2723 domain-containing protein [Deltaproteobacteria bacterium]